MPSRALTFGSIAEAYERFRPGYPVQLFDLVVSYAGRPIETGLEFGAGTGKATRLFAEHGVAVTATEPDASMLAELRKHVPPAVTAVQAAFEEVQLGSTYDLVYVAAALHWTNPAGRWERIAALLEPGGVFASFGGPIQPADAAVQQAVDEARKPFLDTDELPSPDGTPPEQPMQWPGTELLQAESFTDVRQVAVKRQLNMSADEYIGHLSTVSAYLVLPAADRDEVFRRILDVLPARVAIVADIIAHLARRA